jgi:RNA polymerase sigma-70 factor (ECF subfamily)
MSKHDEPTTLFNIPACLNKSLKQKEINAFEFLYDKYATALYSLILSITEDPRISDIILERVFQSAWKKIEGYDDAKASVFTWISGIAREQTLIEKNIQAQNQMPADHLEIAFRPLGSLKELISELPEPCRKIITLSYFENLNDAQIADLLQENLQTIKECKNKGLVILNKLITRKDIIKKPSLISERVLAV